jgi:protocatechuate 3,4-dioxygenase alpha subunit
MTNRIPSANQGTGPLYSFSLIFPGVENAVAPGSDGAVAVSGRILDGNGSPVCWPDGLIEFIQGDQFARAQTDSTGRYRVTLRRPKAVPLADGSRHAPHFEVLLFIHPVLDTLRTRMYFPNDEALQAKDPVLARVPEASRSTLVAKPRGAGLEFDIVLHGDRQTAFLQPASSALHRAS